MPRGRMLSKSISKSEKLAKLSTEGMLLFTWILPHTDVEGRIDADVWTVKSIVPYVSEITPNNIPKLLQEMHNASLILYYGKEHKYLQIIDFLKYQKVRTDQEAPSHIPTPPKQQSNNGVKTELPPPNVSKGNVSKGNRGVFSKPSLTDLLTYIKEYKYQVDAETFLAFYESKGWMVGKSPMKDWKAALRGWHTRNKGDDKATPLRAFGGVKK